MYVLFIFLNCTPEMHVCSRKEYKRRENEEYFCQKFYRQYIYIAKKIFFEYLKLIISKLMEHNKTFWSYLKDNLIFYNFSLDTFCLKTYSSRYLQKCIKKP